LNGEDLEAPTRVKEVKIPIEINFNRHIVKERSHPTMGNFITQEAEVFVHRLSAILAKTLPYGPDFPPGFANRRLRTTT